MERETLNVARLGLVDYQPALALQEALVRARHEDRIADTLLLLEHRNVYTLGRGASEDYLLAPRADVPVYRVSRGGEVTYHGPGQLIGYPILKIMGAARDVHQYLRMLEQAMIDALEKLKIIASRREGLTGVWVEQRKIASIGVGLRRWVTLHGFALNVCPDLSLFRGIVPCGLDGCVMTSVAAEGHAEVTVDSFADLMEENFGMLFGYREVSRIEVESLMEFAKAPSSPPPSVVEHG